MRLIVLFPLLLCFQSADAQRRWNTGRSNEGSVLLVNALYGGHLPAGDLADRFGGNFSAGLGLEYLTKKNFILGIQSQILFGNNVKEDVIAARRDEDGLIFSDDFSPVEIRLRERGLYLGGHIGKIFPLGEILRRSGVKITLGAGMFQHKVRIQDDPFIFVTQLHGDYKKGYDRLTNGLAFTQFIGYHYLANNRLVNFIAGFEFTEAFTRNRRSINFDTRSKEEGRRFDMLAGFRVGWTLPLYIGEVAAEIQY